MSRKVALRWFDAWNRGDIAAAAELMTPDVRVIRPRRNTLVGREAFIEARSRKVNPEVADELGVSFHDREIEESGDRLTSIVRIDYHWRESGEFSHSMQRRCAMTFRDGKIAVLEFFAPELIED